MTERKKKTSNGFFIKKSKSLRSDDWETPKDLYDSLDKEFHFTDDACPLCAEHYADGLIREWGSVVFMNPPYSSPTLWCMKAVVEMKKGKTIVGLLKSDTSTKCFHEWVLPYAEIRFIKGRLRFGDGGGAPFPSIIAIWRLSHSR